MHERTLKRGFRTTMTWRLAVAIAAAALLAAGVGAFHVESAAAATVNVVNGDFETGDFNGWTLFSTENGVVLPTVAPFDLDGDGVSTSSAQLTVGQSVFEGFDVQRGGGIVQQVAFGEGILAISAEVASHFPFSFCNGDGGTVQLLVDDAVVAAHSFGEICGPITLHERLAASVSVTAGVHEIRVLAMRAGTLSGVTNVIDDIVVVGPAVEPPSVSDLIEMVDGFGLSTLGKSLTLRLVAMERMLTNGGVRDACLALNGFMNEVAAQSGRGLSEQQAAELTTLAGEVGAALGC